MPRLWFLMALNGSELIAALAGPGLFALLLGSGILTRLSASKLVLGLFSSGLSVDLGGSGLLSGRKVCDILVAKLGFWFLTGLVGSGFCDGTT